jgi:hypothetical protein
MSLIKFKTTSFAFTVDGQSFVVTFDYEKKNVSISGPQTMKISPHDCKGVTKKSAEYMLRKALVKPTPETV